MIPLVLLFVGVASNAQSEKKAPPPPPPKPLDEKVLYEVIKEPPPVVIKKELLEDFYNTNPSLEKITSTGSVITLKFKNGTIEKYDMKKKEDDKSFTEKYGVTPIPLPPPPPKKVS